MKKVIDWLTLLVGVAGVVVAVWIWQSDLVSRSLHFQMASQTALQPASSHALQGVKLSVDGIDVASPFITVLKLAHDGSRPIQSADFEGPIEIKVKEPSKLVKVQITEVTPKDLRPQVALVDGTITIAPLLLNSSDTATFAVITSGPAPDFSIRSRIAGVSTIELKDVTKRTWSKQSISIFIVLTIAFLLGAAVLISGDLTETVTVRPRVAAPFFLLSLVPPVAFLSILLPAYGHEGVVKLSGTLILAFFVLMPLAAWLNRPVQAKSRSTPEGAPPEAAQSPPSDP